MESIIVVVAVAVASALVGRTIYRTLAGKKSACSCSGGCPFSGDCGGIPPLPTVREQGGTADGPPCLYETDNGSASMGGA